MKNTNGLICSVAALVLIPFAHAEDVLIADAFAGANTPASKVVYIDLARDDVLVFPGGTDLTLHGKRLVISADTIRLDGDAIIRQFDSSDNAAPRNSVAGSGNNGANGGRNGRTGQSGGAGGNGGNGVTGISGRNASDIVLEVGDVVGDGVLRIDNSGAVGGKGEKGGKGGVGGRGGNGRRGRDGAFNCSSGGGDGGNGGRGGNGGSGGKGGKGGNGGTIILSESLRTSINSGQLFVRVSGGRGGAGGDAGEAGAGGGRGNGGGGSTFCRGGRNGGNGSAGSPGPAGSQGPSGDNGVIRFKADVR